MVDNIKYEELENESAENRPKVLSKPDVQLCEHVSAEAEVVACNIKLTIGQLFSLKVGDVVKGEEQIDTPMTLTIGGKAVATGNLVAVGDSFGFEVLEVAK